MYSATDLRAVDIKKGLVCSNNNKRWMTVEGGGKKKVESENGVLYSAAVCFGFSQLLATKNCCGLLNTQLFSRVL
jgi:hypothetical protein